MDEIQVSFRTGDLIVHREMPELGLFEFSGPLENSREIVVMAFGNADRIRYVLYAKEYRIASEAEVAGYVAQRLNGFRIWFFLAGPGGEIKMA